MSTVNYTLLELEVIDFKRIEELRFKFGNVLTVIGGRNGHGKSSAIDALTMLGGAKVPPMPVHRGAEHAIIRAKVQTPNGVLTVTETIDTDRKTTFYTINEEGMKEDKKSLVKSWFSATALDPLAFTRKKPSEQVETLKKIFGLDFSEIDRRRKEAYEKRTGQNAVAKNLEGKYQMLESEPADTPDDEISLSDLNEQVRRIHEHNSVGRRFQSEAEMASQRLASCDEIIDTKQFELNRLQDELNAMKTKRGEIETTALAAQKVAAGYEFQDAAEIEEKIQRADLINQNVRQKKRRIEERGRYMEAKKAAEALTATINECDAEKRRLLSTVKMPVPGLTIGNPNTLDLDDDEAGLYLNGLPFEQASSAEQLRVAVPLAFAENTSLKFAIIRDGSLLDEESMRLVHELTEKAGGQLIIERVVEDYDEATIVLRDGREISKEKLAAEKKALAEVAN